MTCGPQGALQAGLRATVASMVTEADTAIALGSGNVPVLGTPRLLALAEAATLAAIGPYLDRADTSVGTAVRLEHKRASAVGEELVVEAELTEVDGRRLLFSFVARAGGEVTGAGTIERVIVPAARFTERCSSGG